MTYRTGLISGTYILIFPSYSVKINEARVLNPQRHLICVIIKNSTIVFCEYFNFVVLLDYWFSSYILLVIQLIEIALHALAALNHWRVQVHSQRFFPFGMLIR